MLIKYNIILSTIFIALHFLPHLYKEDEQNLLQYYLNKALQLIVIVSIYSIFSTKFLTIYSYMIIVFILLILFYKKDFSSLYIQFIPKQKEIKYLLYMLIIANSILVIQFLLVSDSINSDYINYINRDIVFYSNVSNFLNYSGTETSNVNYLFLDNLKPNVYHYFELWLNALLIKLFHLNAVESLILLSYTLLKTMVVFGAIVFINSDKLTVRSIFAGIFILFFTGIYIPEIYNGTFFDVMKNINWSGWSHPKLLAIYFIATLFMVSFKSFKNREYALIVLSLLPIIYPTTLFGYIGLVIGIIMYKLYFKEKTVLPAFILFLPILFFQFFYSYLGKSATSALPKSINMEYLNTFIHIVAGGIIFLFILYLPFIILFSRNIIFESKSFLKKENIKYIFYTLILLFSILTAIGGYGLLHQTVDSGQVLSNYLPFIQVIVFLLAFRFLSSLKVLFLTIFIVINIVFNFKLYNYSKIDRVKENIQNLNGILGKNRNGAIFFTEKHYKIPFNQYTLTSLPFQEVFFIDSNFKFYDMSIADVNFTSMKNKTVQSDCLRVQKQNPLYLFQKNNIETKDNIKIEFIKKYHITFIMYPKNYPCPKNILEYFSKKTIYKEWTILTKERNNEK